VSVVKRGREFNLNQVWTMKFLESHKEGVDVVRDRKADRLLALTHAVQYD
jgi:hypothetical protein